MPDPDLTDPLVAALARLRPTPATAGQPAFLFRAGQASRDGVARRWKWVAATATALLVGSWAVGVLLFAETDRRLAVAEARLAEMATVQPVAAAPPVVPAPVPPTPPPTTVEAVAPAATAPHYDPDPTPEELADALRLRNDILSAGLGLIPSAKPPAAASETDPRRTLPGGVFATPRLEPKKPMPLFPDEE